MREKSSPALLLDAFDRKILNALQRNNRQSLTVLGEQVGLSEPAIRRRVKALRASGMIISDVSLIAPEIGGVNIIVSISLEKESTDTYDRLKALAHATPEILQCYTVTGDVDFVLIGMFPNMAAYDDWVNEHILTDPAIARSRTNVVYQRVKFDTAINL